MPDYGQIFSEYRYCEFCGRPLPNNYKEDVCPNCKERKLFSEVKDYIREHDVNEYDLAKHFNIPVYKVKEWIRDGRIEYKQTAGGATITGMRCQHCGAPVTFGTLCPKCMKLMNGRKVFGKSYGSKDASKMHILDGKNEEE